jgi:DNA repair protein RadA/Sms
MLLAVLERRCKLPISGSEVYVSTVGGIRLTEPAADLAIALAIASAVRDQPLPPALAAIGEISLAGEIRPVTAARIRATEAKRLGYGELLDGAGGSVKDVIPRAFLRAVPADAPTF